MSLKREKGALPLYAQIAKDLRSKIESGEYAPGDLIPSEKELQKIYDVSRMTVRLAVSSLVNRGYLECHQGIGTLVVYGKIDETLHRVTSFAEEMGQQGITMQTRESTMEITGAPARVARALQIAEGRPVYKLVRVRYVDDKPLIYSVTYLNLKDLPMDPDCYRDSLYAFLKKDRGITITRGEDRLEAVPSDSTVEKMLQITRKPVFKRTRVAFDQKGKPIEHSTSYYPGDKYQYSVVL